MRCQGIRASVLAVAAMVSTAWAQSGDEVLATYTFAGGISQDNGGFVVEDLGVQNFGGQGAIFVRGDDPNEAILLHYARPSATTVARSFVEVVVRNVGQTNGGSEGLLSFRSFNGLVGQFSLRYVTSLESDQSFGPDPQPAGGTFLQLRFDDGVSDTVFLHSSRRKNGKWDAVRIEATPDRLFLMVNGQVEDSAPISFAGFGVSEGDIFRLGGQSPLPAGTSEPTLAADGFTGRILSFAFGSLAEPSGMSLADPPIVFAEAIELPAVTDAPCDLNGDGYVDPSDVSAFFADYASGNADFDLDGTTGPDDMLAFMDCVADPFGAAVATARDCCAGQGDEKPKIGTLRLQYTGLSCEDAADSGAVERCTGDPEMAPVVYIEVTDDADPDDEKASIWFADVVTLGGVFDASAIAAGKDRLAKKTYIHVFDNADRAVLLQSIGLETDCKGPLPPGTDAGSTRLVAAFDRDGVALGGAAVSRSDLLVWFGAADASDHAPTVEAFIQSECGREPVEAGDLISVRNTAPVTDVGANICEYDSKLSAIGFRFTGEPCAVSSVAQADDKWACEGTHDPIASAFVIVSNKEDPHDGGARWFYSGEILAGEEFVATAEAGGKNELESRTYLHVLAGADAVGVLQTVEFRTRCDEPLRVSDRFGAFEVTMLEGKDGARLALPHEDFRCAMTRIDGVLVVTAASPRLVVTATDLDGNTGVASVDLAPALATPAWLAQNPCDALAKPSSLEFLYTANACPVSSNAQKPSRTACEGVPQLPVTVDVLVTDKEDHADEKARWYFSGEVSLGGLLRADAAMAGKGDLGKELYIHALGAGGQLIQTIKVHSSCSEPLAPGDSFGAFYLLGVQ